MGVIRDRTRREGKASDGLAADQNKPCQSETSLTEGLTGFGRLDLFSQIGRGHMSQSTTRHHSGPMGLEGPLAVFAGAVIIAFAAILVKASDLGPQATAFWRLAMALPALGLWMIIDLLRTPKAERGAVFRPPGWRMLALAGVFFTGDLAFWHVGIKITTAANATLLANLTPIPVTIAAFLLFGEQITRRFLIAGAISLIGAFLLAAANLQFAPERLPGDIFSTLTACWYAAYILAVRGARKAGASTVQVMFWSTLIACPLTLVVALGAGETLMPPDLKNLGLMVLLGVIVHAGGQGAIAFGLGRTPASLASLIVLIQPVVSAIAGWVLFGEFLVMVQWFGAGLVLLGVYVAQSQRTPSPPPQARP